MASENGTEIEEHRDENQDGTTTTEAQDGTGTCLIMEIEEVEVEVGVEEVQTGAIEETEETAMSLEHKAKIAEKASPLHLRRRSLLQT